MTLRPLRVLPLALAALLAAAPALAQSGQLAPTETQADRRAPRGPETLVLDEQRGVRPPPLGAEMFTETRTEAAAGAALVDPNHVLRPGDAVRVTLWGLVNSEQELTIDPQGNVVVNGVGPVPLAGVRAGDAPSVIEQASRRVYSSGVRIYATATGASPTQVLVTGPVARPGAYDGASDDALIVYLQRAGGVDAERGSYRRLRVVRRGQTIAEADLYDFLQSGTLPDVSFQNGDAIVVEAQGSTVAVSGDVRAAYSFELQGASGPGSELMRYARPRPGATHAAVVGVRDGAPFSAYLPLGEFATFVLQDGDRVQFESDSQAVDMLVRVEGAHGGASVFSVPRGTTVGAVLQTVPVDADADWEAVHLRRDSVRRTQKQLLNESLDRLERSILLNPARSPSEAQARSVSAQFASQYVAAARKIEPLGVLALNGRDANTVLLETGDVIVIPRRSQVVSIAGEVQAPRSVLADGPARTSSYVDLAGGFTRRADRGHVLVFKQDGQLREGGQVQPGDRILVMAKPDSTLLPFIRDLTQTIFQMAGVLVAIDRFSND